MKIDIISAVNGKIELTFEDDTTESFITVKKLADKIKTAGLSPNLFATSSMDFASDYGFENDREAWRVFNKAIKIAGGTPNELL